MPRFEVVVEETGQSVRTVVFEYEAATRDEALWMYNNGDTPTWAWTEAEDFYDEIHEIIVDVRPVEDANA